MKTMLALVVFSLLLFGCTQSPQPSPTVVPTQTPTVTIIATSTPTIEAPPLPPDKPTSECTKDSDCKITGCSSEVCAKEDVVTTCIYRSDYACYKTASCGCNNGICEWAQTPALQNCLQSARTTTNPGNSDGSSLPPLPV